MMYFITTIENRYGEIGDTRCVGYCETYEEAEEIVLNNLYDLHETIYNYVVIEAIRSGIYQYDSKPHWFTWIEDSYVESEVPPFAQNMVGFAIG